MDTEMSHSAVTGLRKLIQKLDSSSSDTNLTGIAHHAHSTTREILDTLLLKLAPESISTQSEPGKHQPSNGNLTSRELLITDTAQLTREPCTTPELLNNVLNGSETLSQTLDGSSSEDNPTGIAHHAQIHTEDIQLQELLRTETPESQSINSDLGDKPLG
jgi:hypothetical protein